MVSTKLLIVIIIFDIDILALRLLFIGSVVIMVGMLSEKCGRIGHHGCQLSQPPLARNTIFCCQIKGLTRLEVIVEVGAVGSIKFVAVDLVGGRN